MNQKFHCWIFYISCSVILAQELNLQQYFLITEKENYKVISQCLSRIVDEMGNLKIALWYLPTEEDLVLELLKKIRVPAILNSEEQHKSQGLETRTHSDIIIILSGLEIGHILNNTLWNGRTKIFMVCQDLEEVQNNFEEFWSFKVINVFAIVLVDDDIIMYSFLPYNKDDCGIGEPFVVDKYISNQGSFINSGKAYKDPIRLKNLNQCRVNITIVNVKPNNMFEDECGCNATTHLEGIEGNLMTEVAKNLNFNVTFVIALDGIGWGWIYPSPHGAVGEVFTGRSDFAMGLLAPTIERFENLDLSKHYNGEECVTFGVPTGAGASTPNWITILVFEFEATTWILIVFSSIMIFVLLTFINRVLHVDGFSRKINIILYVFSSFLGLPVKTHNYFTVRLSLTFWIIFSFIVTVAYRSSMGSKLTVPNKDPDINTFQELLESKLELTGYKNMIRLFEYNDGEPYIKEILNRFIVTDYDIDYAVDRIAAEKKMAHVRHTTTFLYYALINPKAKGHIHVIKDCILVYYPMVVTKKNSPFSVKLNQLIGRLQESGITKRWRSTYIYKIPPVSKPFIKLSKDHMYGVFCILCFGYVLATVALFMEIYNSKNKKKPSNLFKPKTKLTQ